MHMRIPGVLQQIMVVALVAALKAVLGELQSLQDAEALAAAIVVGALIKLIELFWTEQPEKRVARFLRDG